MIKKYIFLPYEAVSTFYMEFVIDPLQKGKEKIHKMYLCSINPGQSIEN